MFVDAFLNGGSLFLDEFWGVKEVHSSTVGISGHFGKLACHFLEARRFAHRSQGILQRAAKTAECARPASHTTISVLDGGGSLRICFNLSSIFPAKKAATFLILC